MQEDKYTSNHTIPYRFEKTRRSTSTSYSNTATRQLQQQAQPQQLEETEEHLDDDKEDQDPEHQILQQSQRQARQQIRQRVRQPCRQDSNGSGVEEIEFSSSSEGDFEAWQREWEVKVKDAQKEFSSAGVTFQGEMS